MYVFWPLNSFTALEFWDLSLKHDFISFRLETWKNDFVGLRKLNERLKVAKSDITGAIFPGFPTGLLLFCTEYLKLLFFINLRIVPKLTSVDIGGSCNSSNVLRKTV